MAIVTSPRPGLLVLALGTAVTAISSAALFILLAAPLPPLVIAAGRVLVTAVAAGLLGLGEWRDAWRSLRKPAVALRVVLAAVLLAVHFGAWIASLSLTTVPRSVTLVATQPLVAGLFGRFVGDRARWGLYVGAAVAMVGTVVMVHEPGDSGLGFNAGDGLALLAAVAVAAYLVLGRSVRDALPLRPYLAVIHGVAAVMLAITAVATGVDPWPTGTSVMSLLVLVYLGLVPGLVGHGLINWAVRHVPVHTVSLAVLFEPVGSMVLTGIFLARSVTTMELIGAAIVLGGVALGLPRPSGRSATR